MRPSTKRRKDKEPADGGEASDMAADHNVAISGLAELVKILAAKIESIDDSVADKVTKALDATIDSKVEARLRVYESDLRKQIAKLEAQINDSKNNADVNIAPDVATSKTYEDEDDGACSNDLSWIVQKKINLQDGLPVDCALKKEKKDKKTMDSTQNLTNKEQVDIEYKSLKAKLQDLFNLEQQIVQVTEALCFQIVKQVDIEYKSLKAKLQDLFNLEQQIVQVTEALCFQIVKVLEFVAKK
ncbi:hypothetical protein Bca52824_073341 [Brassica carinata]|uniref:Uncharacterized protein n=1 Tax=Brassica carinata TaxID=52824 RepID=A0A8X7QBE2_BRACI|nr:hypothetical protein Bca52824_073341 [Brassica carinata]